MRVRPGVADRSARLWPQVVAKCKTKSDVYEKAPLKVHEAS